jgi:hypothetical protein
MHKDTLLHRQVHPNYIINNKVSSLVFELADDFTLDNQIFIPTTKDDKKLSVCSGEKFTAEEAFLNHIKKLSLKSAGTASVSVDECDGLTLETVEDNNPFVGHAYINFADIEKKEIRTKALVLKSYAMKRGFKPYDSL